MKKALVIPMALMLGVLLAAPAPAKQALKPQDRNFVVKAAQGNTSEVMVGKLALQKSKNNNVRLIAKHLVNDHGAANKSLANVAKSVGVSMPKGPSADGRQIYNKLARLSGSKFDQTFINAELADHRKDAPAYAHEVEHAANARVKDYAATYLPKVQMHAEMLQDAKAGKKL